MIAWGWVIWRWGGGERTGPSFCHPLSQKGHVSAVTFDLVMHTFANGLRLVSCFLFLFFSQGSWVENRFFDQTWDSLAMRSQLKICGVISLMGPEWVGIQMKLNNDRSPMSRLCTRCKYAPAMRPVSKLRSSEVMCKPEGEACGLRGIPAERCRP